jgi:hypothetical protein
MMKRSLRRMYHWVGLEHAESGSIAKALHILIRAVWHTVKRARKIEFPKEVKRLVAYREGQPYYPLSEICQRERVDGFALIFFMGVGDYLMATPLLPVLRRTYPDIPIYAFHSTSTDRVNSALIGDLLRTNPYIQKVVPYQGKATHFWKSYDYRSALEQLPPYVLPLPLLYDDGKAAHRIHAIMDTFGLPRPWPAPVPILYPQPLTMRANALLQDVCQRTAFYHPPGIIITHFTVRSAQYQYPHAKVLIQTLLDQGWLILDFSNTSLEHPCLCKVDVQQISLNDTISLLRTLHESKSIAMYAITVSSLLTSLLAPMQIKHLCMNIFIDDSIHQYYYPHTFFITPCPYPTIPATRLFVAPASGYHSDFFFTYHASYVLECFQQFLVAS